jgi:hypothetical protein
MTDERNLQFNNLRKQIHEYQSREHEVVKFLRLLNKDEDNIKPEYTDALAKILDLLSPNG